MKTFWLHATLLPLFLLGSALPEKQNQCTGSTPQIRRVVVNGNVSVPCPCFTGQEMSFTLHTGAESITVHRNFTNAKELNEKEMKISHHLTENNCTEFVLFNVMENVTGLYVCEAQKTYPPPILNSKECPQTIVIVEEEHQLQRCDNPADHLSLWVGLGVLTMYGLIITYAAFSLRSRLTRVDFNKHDYMNMKPNTRRKNRRIILPVRQSWNSKKTEKEKDKCSTKQVPN
ncbi:T-cell-specific surface glycoprotein CD28 [Colossoma macropomum]|uniref:T-cell-specific surface glycoprotein CD28 n=1 Tax=Colossoma macropomum TaxID=42526 RepID=UPI001863EAB0|nr:T-cell-specific surface glycoprotein CD28 [Colossoma macropomum]